MLNLGTYKPGSKIYVPVNTFDSNDPSASVTATNWASTDCHIHKDAGTTQRASSNGETLSLNFDSITGNHVLEIDTADNTTAAFYAAGSVYKVRIEGVTVDGGTINAWIAVFRLGYPGAWHDTTIATLSSQTSFTLTAGSTDDDAYNGWTAVVHDVASAVQIAVGYVSDYTGSTKTVTLGADPGIFTMAATDNISLFPPIQAGQVGAVADILTDSEAVLADTEASQTSETSLLSDTEAVLADAEAIIADTETGITERATLLTDTEAVLADAEATLADTNELQGDWTNAGRLDAILDAILVDSEAAVTDTEAVIADTEASQTTEAAILTDTEAAITERSTLLTDTEAVLADTETGLTERATLLTDTEAVLADSEAIVVDTEAAITERSILLTDTEAIVVDAEAASTDTENLGLGIIYGAAATGTLSTTQATTDLTGYADDQLIGAVVIWTSGDCEGERKEITDYASSGGLLTFTAMTTAPANNDTFKIV